MFPIIAMQHWNIPTHPHQSGGEEISFFKNFSDLDALTMVATLRVTSPALNRPTPHSAPTLQVTAQLADE
jgi:hypothetical protein